MKTKEVELKEEILKKIYHKYNYPKEDLKDVKGENYHLDMLKEAIQETKKEILKMIDECEIVGQSINVKSEKKEDLITKEELKSKIQRT